MRNMKMADPEWVRRLADHALADLKPGATGKIAGVYRWARNAPKGQDPHEQRGAGGRRRREP
jgi:hypothetical protein